jgi:type IV pilus assembly protein PilX
VLIIGLIMMLILTMIGLTGMQTTTQQEKMSGNLRDRNVAFQAAELALREGERIVSTTLAYKNVPMGGNGWYDFSNPTVIPYHDPAKNNAESLELMADDDTWLNAGAYRTEVIEYPQDLEGAAQRPAYIIVKMPDPVASKSLKVAQERDKELYKVTARGVGASENAVVVMQSTFVPQDCSVPANCP